MSNIANAYKPDSAVHPGEYLEEVLDSRNISKGDFAARCGLSAKTISQIINQQSNFSTEVAIQFERVLGISAEIWTRMLAEFQLHESRARERAELEGAESWAEQFPVKDLQKLGVIERTTDRARWISQLLSFFNVSSPDTWTSVYAKRAIAFRKSPTLQASEYAIATWLRLAELQASEIDTKPFDSKKIRQFIPKLRLLTNENPEVFASQIVESCARAGVAVTFVPELTGTRISGATEWLNADTAMIALSLRHKTDDHFWFTLFHELGHIILHGKKAIFIDDDGTEDQKSEQEANQFARDVLLPRREFRDFVKTGRFYADDIRMFAERINIAPGIVVGVLQHDGLIKYSWHNQLKRRFTLKHGEHPIST